MPNIKKNRGFTLIELMLVMAIAAVMASLKMQDDKLDMTQLQSRKLGVNELFVYNLGVQKYISDLAGQVPAPAAYPKFYTGVDWLKNQKCLDPALAETPAFVPCSFLKSSGGKTTLGAMSFSTTIDYDSSSGYTARTVLSKMAGTAAGESNSGVLGMAALVASGSLAGSDGGASSGGSITYCPDITPMPSGMVPVCGAVRDQIVMIVNANGTTDQWLRVDHGNVMKHAIEFGATSGASPALNSELEAAHPTMRQIRNVARIYNMGASGNENLYIGNKSGKSATSIATLASNAVIIDADQEVLGNLVVQGSVTSDFDVTAKRDVKAQRNLEVGNNATVKGTVRSESGSIVADSGNVVASSGDLIANSGVIRASNFIDSNNTGYYSNPSATSNINAANIRGRLNALGSAYIGIVRTEGYSCSPNGSVARTSAGKILSCVSGRWRGGGASKVVVSSPFYIGNSGTNNSGHPMIVTVQSNPWNSDGNATSVNACGRRMAVDETPWKATMSSAVVPNGCSWSVGVYRGTPYRVYGQYIKIQ